MPGERDHTWFERFYGLPVWLVVPALIALGLWAGGGFVHGDRLANWQHGLGAVMAFVLAALRLVGATPETLAENRRRSEAVEARMNIGLPDVVGYLAIAFMLFCIGMVAWSFYAAHR